MDPLSIALAVFGGYQGFRSAQRSHQGLLGTLFSTGLGAFGGSQLGSGITSLGADMAPSVFGEGTFLGTKINPFASAPLTEESALLGKTPDITKAATIDQAAGGIKTLPVAQGPQFAQLPTATYETNPAYWNQALPEGKLPTDIMQNTNAGITSVTQPVTTTSQAYNYNPSKTISQNYNVSDSYTDHLLNGSAGTPPPPPSTPYTDKSLTYQYFHNTDDTINWGRTGLAGGLGTVGAIYASGALDPKPKQALVIGSNTLVPQAERNMQFKVQNPQTGEVTVQQPITSLEEQEMANPRPNTISYGPYQAQKFQYSEGGLAEFAHFRDGGINYLPSKTVMDEDNPQNYVRANGYVEDSMQAGNKNEDTMLAQLADGEFVTRTDGILGAGILAGADPTNEKEMKKLGADFFYEQQRRFKRIFDLLDASRKATTH